MERHGKFEPRHEHDLTHGQKLEPRLFKGVEDLLRHDALHTPVPPSIEHRLQASLERNPISEPRKWWRRLLGS
jgi:hypothetical protein